MLVQLPNEGIVLTSFPIFNVLNSFGGNTIDAAGESVTFIGQVVLEGGVAGGSKVMSSAGGTIKWRTNSGGVTFANAGTTLRLGIQDVAATGIEDGTFDVYADLVGVTDTIVQGTMSTAMETGTKTLNHGDTIAVSFELLSRAGADSLNIANINATGYFASTNFPYVTVDSGAGPAKAASTGISILLVFDDGTTGHIGTITGTHTDNANATSFTYNNGSSPDEYAAIFKVPFKCSLKAVSAPIGSIASTDNFEIILYSDPLGTPAVIETITVDPDFTGSASTNNQYIVQLATSRELSKDTWYGVAVRPSTANSITYNYINLGTTNTTSKNIFSFGPNIKVGGRTNQTGAFVETQTYHMPMLGVWLDKVDNGDGGGNFTFG